MKSNTKSIVFFAGAFILLLLLLSTPKSLAYAYTLIIYSQGGSYDQDRDGVDIYVYNQDTGLYWSKSYLGLPPSSITFNMYDSDFPPYSYFNVCAFSHTTNEIYNCETDYYRTAQTNYVDFNLNP